MKRQEFLDKIQAKFNLSDHSYTMEKYIIPAYKMSINKPYDTFIAREFIYIEWFAGGIGGGSCWGNDSHYDIPGDSIIPDFDILYNIIEYIADYELSFNAMRKLLASCIRNTTYTSGDYYGNTSSYNVNYVNLSELYDHMVEANIIVGE